MDQLVEMLGDGEILEPMHPQVEQGGVAGETVGGGVPGRLGDEDLAAVSGGHDPGGPVHHRPEVVAVPDLGVTGVDPHPHLQRSGGLPALGTERPLGLEHSAQSVGHCVEHRDHPVTGGLEDSTPRRIHRLGQDGVVSRQRRCHLGGVFLPESGARLDVGEEERLHPGRI